MEQNENFVEQTENVEQTTEQTPKMYSQEEVDAMMGKRTARIEKKVRKEYERKYGDLEEVLKAGTGKEDVGEITDTFRQFYEKKGIRLRQKPSYSDEDIRVLAKAEAEDIIRNGYDEVVEEVDRLAGIGVENMTAREKAVFKTLAEHRQSAERGRELSQIGVTEDVYNSKEFTEFASQFKSGIPVTKIYDNYRKMQPQKEIKPMGSMKNTVSDDDGVKDYYTPDEAKRFTLEDLKKNPRLEEALWKSARKWK